MALPTIARRPRYGQADTRAAVLRGEFDTGVFQRILNFGEGLDSPSDRAVAPFQALHGGQVDTGPLSKLARGPTQESARRANLSRIQHTLNFIKLLQHCGNTQKNCSKQMNFLLNEFGLLLHLATCGEL